MKTKWHVGQRVAVYDYDHTAHTTIDNEPEIHCRDEGSVLRVGRHHLFVDTDWWSGPAWYTMEQCRGLGKKRKSVETIDRQARND
jgi:hypothetical protein